MIPVIMRSYSNFRDGANLSETILTALQVQKLGVELKGQIQLPDDLRGTEGQPLLVPSLIMGDAETHDVLFVATMYNDVFAYDAHSFEVLWKQHIGASLSGTRAMDMFLINDHWGVLSTPVIDLVTHTLYVCSMSSPSDDFSKSDFYLHALSIYDGSDRAPPLSLNEATYRVIDAEGQSHTSTFGKVARKQRCGLALNDNTVFIACGSFLESAATNQGWVIAVDVISVLTGQLFLAGAWTSTSRYQGGGIWMGAQAPAIDSDGFLYITVGNGAFDGVTDFGESFVKLRYIPPAKPGGQGTFTVTDWFTPYTDTGRVGADPTLADVSLIPNTQSLKRIPKRLRVGDTPATSNMDDPGDEDLNSGGPLFLSAKNTGFSTDLILGAGKDGILYVINADNMGRPSLADFDPTRIEKNVYGRLMAPPYGFTYYPAGMNLAPTDLSTLQTTYGGYTHHQHSTPVYYKSPRFGNMLFTGGENGPVRVFSISENQQGSIDIKYLGCGDVIASGGMLPPGGMPGTMMVLSANGEVEDTAVLWCLSPYGDANKTITDGRLVAYGADWITLDGQLVKIWDSQDWGIAFKHNKFNIPTVANGKVYVPTYDARILVFGLTGA